MKNLSSKILALAIAVCLVFSFGVFAMADSDVTEYSIDAVLSCEVTAMGSTYDFGSGIVESAVLNIYSDGTAEVVLYFQPSSCTVMGVKANTYLTDDSTPGYYNEDGEIVSCEYTTADDDGVTYVSSMTIPVTSDTTTYTMFVYIDSFLPIVNTHMMGCQFSDGSGSAGSNEPGEISKYTGTLTLTYGDEALYALQVALGLIEAEEDTTEEEVTEEEATEETSDTAEDESEADTAITLGDVDLDGDVDTTDARLALIASLGLEALSDEATTAGDIDGDGTVSMSDARVILRAALQLDTL